MLRSPAHRRETGSALIAAIALTVIGVFIVVAIMAMSRSSSEGARAKLEAQASEQLARDAGSMLATIYSSVDSGEHDGFVPSATALQQHSAAIGGRVVPNSRLGSGLGVIDAQRVPPDRRVTVQQQLDSGRTGYWQVLSARLPDWGLTSGGRVTIYLRTWTMGGGRATKPMVYRLDFRPTWFGDYQMLFDGPVAIGRTTQLNGRVHSNGYRASFYNQYDPQYDAGLAIRLEAGARCVGNARLSVSNRGIGGPGIGGCPAANRIAARTPRVNILRAQDMATRLRAVCALPPSRRPSVQIACLPAAPTTTVRLAGNIVFAGGRTLNAAVAGNAPGRNQGAIVVASGDVQLSGTLGANARATVVAASPPGSSRFGTGSAPTIWVRGTQVGSAAGARRSAFGAVAEGDIIFDERLACPLYARGAFIAVSGLPSMHPTWRSPFPTAGGVPCRGNLTIEGSIVAHYPPAMMQPTNNSGYAGTRTYRYLGSLYDNPPPMFPTADDWALTAMSPANLDCFRNGTLASTQECA